MTERVLFVVLENVQKVDLSCVPADARVMIFFGVTQKKLPEELVVQAQPLGPRLKWVKISGQGPNALNFHIAFYLGQEVANSPCGRVRDPVPRYGLRSPDSSSTGPRSHVPPGELVKGRISGRRVCRGGSFHSDGSASQEGEGAPCKAQRPRG
jgi:hypothetical protein